MLLDFEQMVEKYQLDLSGVLHCGAHFAEEAQQYAALEAGWVVWVEGNPDLYERIYKTLGDYDNQRVVCALITNQDGAVSPFNITNHDSMSSSVLEFGTHAQEHPDTVMVDHRLLPTRTIDSLHLAPTLLVMDLQGAELLALWGARHTLRGVQAVYTEVNRAEVYVDCARFEEINQLLVNRGFIHRATHWTPHEWGDALWVR